MVSGEAFVTKWLKAPSGTGVGCEVDELDALPEFEKALLFALKKTSCSPTH